MNVVDEILETVSLTDYRMLLDNIHALPANPQEQFRKYKNFYIYCYSEVEPYPEKFAVLDPNNPHK